MRTRTSVLTALLSCFALTLSGCGYASYKVDPSTLTENSVQTDIGTPDTPNTPDNPDTPDDPDTPDVPETDTSTPSISTVESMLTDMTLDEKIHQLFIITPEALTGFGQVTQFGDASKQALDEHPVAGLIYFSANLEDAAQTRDMLTSTQDYAKEATGMGMFLAVDEEGGTVARVADNLGTTAMESMQTYGERGNKEEAFTVGSTIGNDIHGFGFNLDFAPVADVNLCDGNELGDRIFSDDPALVGDMVAGVTQGLQSTGVAATLKHFPGLGAEDGNAHTDDAIVIDRSLDELRAEEFVPFQIGIEAGADFVMVSHQIVTGIGDDVPASLSKIVCTDLLRSELGFDGIIITDSFQMNTISGSHTSAEAAVMAIQAGVDIVLMPENFEEALQGVHNAVENGDISEQRIDESVRRVLAEKEKLGLIA